MTLRLSNVYSGYSKGEYVLEDFSCSFAPSSVTAVIGANGSGKSTLLKTVARRVKTFAGSVEINGRSVADYSVKELARTVAMLPQVRNVPSIPARALVMHGRFPYLPFPRIASTKDREIADECMRITDTLQFADRDVSELSGGQRQRVYIAMLLAQETPIVMLDEPTTFLDLSCQFEVLELIKSLKAQGKCVITVMHDVSQALSVADEILLVADGKNAFYGTADALLISGALEKHMNVTPRKATDDGKEIYYFTGNK